MGEHWLFFLKPLNCKSRILKKNITNLMYRSSMAHACIHYEVHYAFSPTLHGWGLKSGKRMPDIDHSSTAVSVYMVT